MNTLKINEKLLRPCSMDILELDSKFDELTFGTMIM